MFHEHRIIMHDALQMQFSPDKPLAPIITSHSCITLALQDIYQMPFPLFNRHNSFRRHLPRQMNVTSVDFSMDTVPLRQSSTVSIGRIKPELYKQKSVDSEDEAKEPVETCGKLSFSLRYDYEAISVLVDNVKCRRHID